MAGGRGRCGDDDQVCAVHRCLSTALASVCLSSSVSLSGSLALAESLLKRSDTWKGSLACTSVVLGISRRGWASASSTVDPLKFHSRI